MRFKLCSLLAAVLFVGISVAQAGPGRHGQGEDGGRDGRDGRDGRKMMKMMKELDLSAEQKEKLKTERQKNQATMKALRDSQKAAREKLRAGFQSNASNEELKNLHKEVQTSMTALMDARFSNMLSIREILTPEQRAKFKDWNEDGE